MKTNDEENPFATAAQRFPASARSSLALSLCLLFALGGSSKSYAAILCSGNPVPATVTVGPASITESGTPAQFVFTLGGPVGDPTRLTIQISGTASNGVDYLTIANQVSIPALSSRATLAVTPISDSAVEGAETVTVRILSSDNACVFIGSPEMATVSIMDDPAPAVSIELRTLNWVDGELHVKLTGTSGLTYSLQASTNLVKWTTVTNVTLSTNPMIATLPAFASRSFYRAVTPAVP